MEVSCLNSICGIIGVSPVEAAPGSLRGAHPAFSGSAFASARAHKMLSLGPNQAGPNSTQAQIPLGCWNHPLSPYLAWLGTLNTAQSA